MARLTDTPPGSLPFIPTADWPAVHSRVSWLAATAHLGQRSRLATTAYMVQQGGTAYLVHYAARRPRVGTGIRSQQLYSWLRLRWLLQTGTFVPDWGG